MFSLNLDSRSSVETLQKPPQHSSFQGDAPCRWQKTLSRQMDEDGAAAPRHAWAGIMVDLDDQIVEVVRAPKPVSARSSGELDRPVVTSIGRVLAPPVVRPGNPDRQRRARPRASIRPPPDPDGMEDSARRRTVSFTLISQNAAAAKRDRNGQIAGKQPTLATPPRPRSYLDTVEWPPSSGFRRTKATIFSARKAF
jgi:hypothetical protein